MILKSTLLIYDGTDVLLCPTNFTNKEYKMKINQSMWNGFKLVMIRTYHKNAIREYKTSNKELIICGSIGRILTKRTKGRKVPENILAIELDMRNVEDLHPFCVCFDPREPSPRIALLNEKYIQDVDADGNAMGYDTDELYIDKPFGTGEQPVHQGWNMTFDGLSNLLEDNREFFLDNYLGKVEGAETVS